MIIDAMDILYNDNVDGFCIVSSDSDFTRLSTRIRESGKTAIGFGEKKTPNAFVASCDKFVYTEILRKGEEIEDEKPIKKKTKNELRGDAKLVYLLRNTVEDLADENGWAYLGEVGSLITTKSPDFDPRNYGCKKIGELIKASDLFEYIDKSPNKDYSSIYIRDKRHSG